MDTWEPWKPAIRWPIDLTLQNRVYFVFIAEFVERLPTIFPANIWSTYLFETEHRWAKWLISDPSPKGTRWIYGAFLVSKFKTSYHTCYFSIQIFNPVIKTWSSFIQIWYPSIPISSSSIKLLVWQFRYAIWLLKHPLFQFKATFLRFSYALFLLKRAILRFKNFFLLAKHLVV